MEVENLNIPSEGAKDQDKDAFRACDRENCQAEGKFRAPRARDHLNSYYWFCLEHVREYNAAWDYFAGFSAEEIERHRRRDATWQRPSWPFAGRKANGDPMAGIRDDFGFFGEKAQKPHCDQPKSERDRALALLNLDNCASFSSVKSRYKELVKQLHPDANGGDPQAEEQLKVVNQAYATLKAAFSR